jgi:hypothetical protein
MGGKEKKTLEMIKEENKRKIHAVCVHGHL